MTEKSPAETLSDVVADALAAVVADHKALSLLVFELAVTHPDLRGVVSSWHQQVEGNLDRLQQSPNPARALAFQQASDRLAERLDQLLSRAAP